MSGKAGRSGPKKLPLSVHVARGTYRPDRHGPLPNPNAKSALSPAMRHQLLAGWPDRCRLRGWLEALQASDADLVALWRTHREELVAEAQGAGFEPAGAVWFEQDKKILPDEARDRWSAAFCQRWGYQKLRLILESGHYEHSEV